MFPKSLIFLAETLILSHIRLQLHLLLINPNRSLTLSLLQRLHLVFQPATFTLQLQHFRLSLTLLLSNISVELIVSFCRFLLKLIQLEQEFCKLLLSGLFVFLSTIRPHCLLSQLLAQVLKRDLFTLQ